MWNTCRLFSDKCREMSYRFKGEKSIYKKYNWFWRCWLGAWCKCIATRKDNLCAYWQTAGTRVVPVEKKKFVVSLVSCEGHTNHIQLTRPIVIEVAHFVGQDLHLIWRQHERIVDNVVGGWGYSTLANRLWNQEEVVAFRHCDYVIDDGTGNWITISLENTGILEGIRNESLVKKIVDFKEPSLVHKINL